MQTTTLSDQEWAAIPKALLASPVVGFALTDRHDRIRLVNATTADLAGVPETELVGSTWTDHLVGSDLNAWASHQAAISASGAAACVVRTTRAGDEPIALEFQSARVVLAKDGDPFTASFIRSATASLAVNDAMIAVSRLAGGIANDFNNVLSVILNYADFARRNLPGDHGVREHIETIRRAALRAADLTRQLALFSAQRALPAARIELGQTVQELLPALRRTAGDGIEIHVACDASSPLVVSILPAHLQQLLVHLTENARDAMPLGGRLLIRLSEIHTTTAAGSGPERLAELSFEDTGIGMTAEVARHALEPFFTTKSGGGSSGVGLTVAWGVVTAAGGTLSIETAPGEGSTIRLRIPTTPGPIPIVVPTRSEAPRGRGESILVVDDEPELLRIAVHVLSEAGYSVRAVERPDLALELCTHDEHPVDLLLTDIVMPRMHGNDLAAYLRALRPGMRVLFMSGHAQPRHGRHRTWDQDAGFLQKPFESAQLLHAVRSVLDAPGIPRTSIPR